MGHSTEPAVPATPLRGAAHLRLLVLSGLEMVLSFGASIVVARALMVEGRGQLGRWSFYALFAANLAYFGVGTALPQVRGAGRTDLAGVRRLASSYVLYLGPAAVIAALCMSPFGFRRSDGSDAWGWWWLALLLPAAMVAAAAAQAVLVAAERPLDALSFRVGSRLLYAGVAVAQLLLGVRQAWIAASLIALHGIGSAIAFLVVAKAGRPLSLSAPLLRETLRKGGANHVPAVIASLSMLLDQGFAYSRLDNQNAGTLAAALSAAQGVEVLAFVELSLAAVALADPLRRATQLRTSLARASLLGAGLACTAWVLAPSLVPRLYGASFVNAVPVLRVLVVAAAAANLGRIIENALQAAALERLAWSYQVIRSLTLVLALFAMRTHLTAIRIAEAILVANVAATCGALGLLWRNHPDRISVAQRT